VSGNKRGVDVSSWQHPAGKAIDWPAVKAAGIEFAMVKATQDVNYTNPYLHEDLAGARAAGLLVGAYHYVTPGTPGEEQARYFIQALMGQPLELGAWLDWEMGPLPDWEVTTLYNALRLETDQVRPGTGLYTGGAWRETFGRLNLPIARLWEADWGIPAPPAGCLVWQRGQETVAGIEGPVDVDELLSTRPVNLPRPAAPPAAPVAGPAAGPTPAQIAHEAEVALARSDAALAAAEEAKAAEVADAATDAAAGALAVPRVSP